MIFAVDVQYEESCALAAGVLFPDWEKDEVESDRTKPIKDIAPYEPGSFYKRELPCILPLLAEVAIELEAIVVDGYVTLGPDSKPGLGMYLYEYLRREIPVVGVAKNRFKDTPAICEVLRGNSQNPLLVTAAGMPLTEAKQRIIRMHGENRIPTLLKRVDQLCRGILEPA